MASQDRRREIVLAALRLLGELPVEELSTRRIARQVGISQPGLFRHFRGRDAILDAVVLEVRERLAQEAAEVLAGEGLARVRRLSRSLGAQAARSPGVLRLLLWGLARPESHIHKSLAALVDTQAALVSELVRQAQVTGEVPSQVDASAAGRAFVALLQGTLFGGDGELEPAVDLWLAGVKAGQPAGAAPEEPVPEAPGQRALARLDVRPILQGGRDPLETILGELRGLRPSGLLRVTAPFAPRPLVVLLEGRGHRVELEQRQGLWELEVYGAQAPGPLDLRELEAPEPLHRLLEASASLQAGQALIARTPLVPRHALPLLLERGLQVELLEEPDGTGLIWVGA